MLMYKKKSVFLDTLSMFDKMNIKFYLIFILFDEHFLFFFK
jgi:hypothetical protein